MRGERWRVQGGSESGGILVRVGRSLTSEQLPDLASGDSVVPQISCKPCQQICIEERLSAGALVRELELVGDRLHYEKLSGR